jgi:hypothetical protein
MNMRRETNISELPFKTKLDIAWSLTDFLGLSLFIALWTSEFEIVGNDKKSVDWL